MLSYDDLSVRVTHASLGINPKPDILNPHL